MMHSTHAFCRRAAALCALALAAGACSDRTPSAVPLAEPDPASPAVTTLRCTVAVRAGTMACEPVRAAGSSARGVILGGQGTNVRLASSGTAYDSTTQTLSTSVTVQNLTPQPLGTTDGYTPADDGVRVFFQQKPVVVSGSGTVTVANPDGLDVFTAGNQPYFQYDGILSPGDVSAGREWRFNVPLSATAFVFQVYVTAPVPSERGWIELSPIAPSLQVGDTLTLADSVRHATGQVLPAAPVTWITSDSAVAIVDSAGRVAATGPGSATITASSGPRSGRVTVVVTAAGETPPPTIVSFTLSSVNVTANGTDTLWARIHARSRVGIWQASAGVYAVPQGNSVACRPEFESGSWDDGVFTCPLVIPAGANSGVWQVGLSAGNPTQRGLGPGELRDAGSVWQISVRSPNEDVTPPAVTSFTFSPDTVVAGDSVTIEVSFTDAGVGANQGGGYFHSGVAPNVLIGCETTGLVAGTAHAGTFRCPFTVPAGTPPGTWNAVAQLIDRNFNVGTTGSAELQAAGYPTTLVVLPPDGG